MNQHKMDRLIDKIVLKQAKIADNQARLATERLREELQAVAKQIAQDQAEWLDRVMKDILPPPLYEAGRHGDKTEDISAYLKQHKYQIIFIPDRQAIRVMRGTEIHAQFLPQYTLDGEPLDMSGSPAS